MPEKDRGFYKKFDVIKKSTGEVVSDSYSCFTIVVERDPAAYLTLQAYADAVESDSPQLAADLRALAEKAPDFLDEDGEPVFANGSNS